MHARPQSFDKPIKTKKSESNSKNSQNKKLDNPANNQKEDDAVSVAPSINLISFEPATDPNQLSSNQNQSNNPFEQIVNGNVAQPVATNNINNDLAGIDLLGGVSVPTTTSTTTGANNNNNNVMPVQQTPVEDPFNNLVDLGAATTNQTNQMTTDSSNNANNANNAASDPFADFARMRLNK